jgi:hypothetical protein
LHAFALYMNFCFANKVQYDAIERKLFPWFYEVVTNLHVISNLWIIFLKIHDLITLFVAIEKKQGLPLNY